MSLLSTLRPLLIVLSGLAAAPHLVLAQESQLPQTSSAQTPLSVTEKVLEAKTQEAESNTGLSQAERDQLIELYNKTRSSLETIRANEAKSESYAQALISASKEAKSLREHLDGRRSVPPQEELGLSEDSSLEEIEPLLLKEKADRTTASAHLVDLKRLLSTEEERLDAIQTEVNDARKKLGKVSADLNSSAPEGQSEALTEALLWRRQAASRALSGEISMLGQELLSQPARVELIKARLDVQEVELERFDGRVRYLEELAGRQRMQQAQQAQQQAVAAEQKTLGKNPLLQQVAEENTQLSAALQKVTAQLEDISVRDDKLLRQADKIEAEFQTASQKLGVANVSEALGQVLQSTKRELPDSARLAKERSRRERLTDEVTLRQLLHSQQLKVLRLIDNRVADLTEGMDADDIAEIEGELSTLLLSKRDLLERFIATDNAFLRALSELELAQRRLGNAVDNLDKLLSKRLLWIRSAPGIGRATPTLLFNETRRLWGSIDLATLPDVLLQRALNSWLLLPGLLLVLLLRLRRRRLYQRLRDTTVGLHKPSTDSFLKTLRALLITVLIAIPWPLLMWLLGGELQQLDSAARFIEGLGQVLMWLAPVYFHISVFYVICKPCGLAMEHFRWPRPGVDALRKRLSLFIWSYIPATLLTGVIIVSDPDSGGGEWGRLSLVLMLVLMALFFYSVFRKGSRVVEPFIEWAPGSMLARLHYLWLSLGVLLPLALLVASLFGYVYTAITLSGDLVSTFWLVIVLVVVQQMAVRWVMVSRRRIAFRLALERRAARLAAAEAEEGGDDIATAVEDEPIDVAAMSDESRRIIGVLVTIVAAMGLWGIWKDVVPALTIFSDVHLWNRSTIVDGVETLQPVTLTSVLMVLLVLATATYLLRRQSQLLQLILIEVFDMSAAGRYTVSTLASYAVILGASLYVFSVLGVDWSKLQWLVAALGVGIGFGLQEIVANFISGLIILFERPIRVGDVVTVGEVDGVVTRIRIRATTIRDWDNKELLVPNKEFITNRLLNWSLSDPTTRLLVRVGIAYGSDVVQATDLLLEAANENELVMDDPAPSVVFEAFGDNTLNMVLRCYIPNPDQRMGTISAINLAVNDKFSAAGIQIAFPQRDVHLDIGQPLEVRIGRAQT